MKPTRNSLNVLKRIGVRKCTAAAEPASSFYDFSNIATPESKKITEERAHQIDQHSLYSWGIKDFLGPRAVYPSHGDGVYFIDVNGKKYLDFSSQAVCSNLGHTCPDSVIDAVTAQMKKMPFMFGDTCVSQVRAEYSEKLAKFVPGDINSFLFLSSGAEANEQAVRIAQRVTGRQKVFSAHRSYHGGTGGSLSLTGDPRRHFVPSVPGHVKFLDPNPYLFSWGDTEEEVVKRSLGTLRAQMISEGTHTIAALILESIVGTNGYIRYPEGYMEGVRAMCDEFGIMMICDEVMTGFCRSGKKFGFQNYDIYPDIITCAKGITGAWLPLSAVGIRDHLHEGVRKIPLGGGSTYVGHPTCLAAASAVLDILDRPEFLDHVNAMSGVVMEEMTRLKEKHACVKDIRTVGLFGAVEFAGDINGFRGIQQMPNPSMMDFRFKLIDNGLFTFTAGAHIAITPPLIITEEQVREGFEKIDKTIVQMGW